MINIEIEQLYPWLQKQYEEKYGDKLQPLKKTFLVFYNLSQQIISIYNYILDECKKNQYMVQYPSTQLIKPLQTVVNRTTYILHKLIDNQKLIKNEPGAITMSFCNKFLLQFLQNLNILCTCYHSLNHCEILGNTFNTEKNKIVEGINLLFTIQTKIKQLYKANQNQLRIIEHQKLYTFYNIDRILLQRQVLYKSTKVIFITAEEQAADFYQNFNQAMKYEKKGKLQGGNLDGTSQLAIKSLMKNYFRVLHRFSQAQAQLESLLKPLVFFCEQTKNNKKVINYIIADSINIFRRITSQLLKQNYSLKNFKKVRVQDLNKALLVILEEIMASGLWSEYSQNNDILGHRICKQLGIGLYQPRIKQEKKKQSYKQKEKEKQKEKQKNKTKDKDKDKGKQKDKSKQKQTIHQKQSNLLQNTKSRSRYLKGRAQIMEHQQNPQKSVNKPQEHQFYQDQYGQNQYQQLGEDLKKQQKVSQDFSKWIPETPQQKIQVVVDQICECATFIMDCMKELDKVQSSGLLNMIQQYKQKLNVSHSSTLSSQNSSNANSNNMQLQSSRKLISKLCEYQKYISQYYRLHENIKQFQKIIKQIALQEFRIRINVIVGIQPDHLDQQINVNTKKQKAANKQENMSISDSIKQKKKL